MSIALYHSRMSGSGSTPQQDDGPMHMWCTALVTALLGACIAGVLLGCRWGWPSSCCMRSGGIQRRMDDLVKAVQQLQALVHAEGYATRQAGVEALQQVLDLLHEEGPLIRACTHGFTDGTQRVQAIMNKLMKVSGTIDTIHAMHANLGNTLASHQMELQRTMQKAKEDLKQAFAKATDGLGGAEYKGIADTLQAIQTAMDETKQNTSTALEGVAKKMMKDYGDLQRFLGPLQRNQESFGTGMNGRFEQLQKELSSLSYGLSKQLKDLSGQLRWAQQSLDRIQGDSEHLPDKLNFLRGLLETTKEQLEAVQKEIESWGAEQSARSPTTEPTPPPGGAPAATTQSATGPTMLNLDESLPVMQRQGQGYLCPITLPDGEIIFIPKAVLAQMLGAHVV